MIEGVLYQGLVLPPVRLRQGEAMSDGDYVHSARLLVGSAQRAGLTSESRVLDIGCGSGRLITGLHATHRRVNEYIGLDIKKDVVDWCRGALTDSKHGSLRFEWIGMDGLYGHSLALL